MQSKEKIANTLYTYSINHVEIGISEEEGKPEEHRGTGRGGDQEREMMRGNVEIDSVQDI